MMAERLYLGGITNTVIHEESDGTMIVEERQDCQSILDQNARLRNERFDSWSPEGTVREEFNIPLILIDKWQKECGESLYSAAFDAYMDKKLREPEFAYLVSAPMRRDPHIIITGAR
jgi:hypothetical protein